MEDMEETKEDKEDMEPHLPLNQLSRATMPHNSLMVHHNNPIPTLPLNNLMELPSNPTLTLPHKLHTEPPNNLMEPLNNPTLTLLHNNKLTLLPSLHTELHQEEASKEETNNMELHQLQLRAPEDTTAQMAPLSKLNLTPLHPSHTEAHKDKEDLETDFPRNPTTDLQEDTARNKHAYMQSQEPTTPKANLIGR